MAALRMQDLRTLNESVLILNNDQSLSTFVTRLKESLSVLISAEVTAVECFDANGVWTNRLFADPAPLVERCFPAFLRERASHPLVSLFEAGQLWQPRRISDVVSQSNLEHRSIFSEFFKPLGVDRQMAVTIEQPGGSAAVLVFSRKGKDFSKREVEKLSMFVAHACSAQRAAVFLAMHSADRVNGHHLKPSPLGAPTLSVKLGITEREAQVIHWLANGKTDLEIGLICGVSTRTVQKHCENIYRKLGVESRTAALVRAFEVGVQPGY